MSEHVNNENERSVDIVDDRLIFRYTYTIFITMSRKFVEIMQRAKIYVMIRSQKKKPPPRPI